MSDNQNVDNTTCEKCKKKFSSKSNLVAHKKKSQTCKEDIIVEKHICNYCDKELSTVNNLNRHLLTCSEKQKKQTQENLERMEKTIKDLENIKQQLEKELQYKDKIFELNNKQIEDKDKQIQELQDTIRELASKAIDNKTPLTSNTSDEIEIRDLKEEIFILEHFLQIKTQENIENKENTTEPFSIKTVTQTCSQSERSSEGTRQSLILNDITISTRNTDNYVNVTELCKAGGKKYNDWYRLQRSEQFLTELSRSAGIPADLLIQVISRGPSENRGSWCHPQVAINIAQWISPKFDVLVSKHILELYTNGTVELENHSLQVEIEKRDKRIKYLENKTLKKQARVKYVEDGACVIYIVANKGQVERREYKFGKSNTFKDRVSTYNSGDKFDVIYFKECKDVEHMGIVEDTVFYKLKDCRLQGNREIFVLPQDRELSYFTNIIDECVNQI